MSKKYKWLNEASRTFLKRGYFEEPAEERIREIAETAEQLLKIKGFADKFEDYMARGFYSLATPVWTNFGKPGRLPISCYGSMCEDTLDSILNVGREIGMMSKYGGGTSLYLGELRPRGSVISTGGFADGPTHYTEIYDTIIDKCSQGSSRRGACAVYLPVEHPDIMDWLDIGTEGNPIQNLQYGVCVGKKWLKDMREGDEDKQDIWAKILTRRAETGFPYIFFTDNANVGIYKKLKMPINHSNLCTEIMLANNIRESFVCCIGSINLLYWDKIKDTDAIETYTLFLNAVLNDFIKKSRGLPGMKRSWRFANRHRAIGLGVLGYHSYLQSKLIPFESLQAKAFNNEVFKTMNKRANEASKWLHDTYGYTSLREGYANTTVLAVAPTKSSSFILEQVSMQCEPIKSNYFVKDLAKIKYVYKNPYLETELEKYGLNTTEVWEEILAKDGSCQHLDFPSKEVFKTFIEISPKELVLQAAQRQKYIDQGQSLNLMIHPKVPAKEINKLYLYAADEGIKALYYQFSQSAAQSFAREINSCVNCEA